MKLLMGRPVILVSAAALALCACVPLGMTLPSDDFNPPVPDGGRIKPSLGWLSTEPDDHPGPPDGSVSIELIHLPGRTVVEQVRHYHRGKEAWGDSIVLDRATLRPITTWRWTPAGTYVTRYNHRSIERSFRPLHGGVRHSVETVDVEPYSALGAELLIASLPLAEGVRGVLPVAVDTEPRGWTFLHYEVEREIYLQERPDQPQRDVWIVDVDIGHDRLRYHIAMDGRSVRRIEWLDPDNNVTALLRRMLLSIRQPPARP